MASPTASEDPDLRTSSGGRKRGYDEFVTFEARPGGVEGVSAEGYDAQLEKRRRYDDLKEAPLRAPSTEQFKPQVELANISTGVAENDDASHHWQNQVHVAMSPAITWNQGVPIPIRTSFGASTPQKQPQSYQPSFVQRQIAIQDIPAIGRASMQATEASLTRETVNVSTLSTPQMPSTHKAIADTVQKPRPGETRIKNDNWRWIFTDSDKLIAETIISSLPERQRDLMPCQIPGNSLPFTNKGCRLVLGRIDVSLREICFVEHQKDSFVARFLKRNSAVLENIDYSVLASAFSKHLGLFYRHLPKKLVSLVSKNKRIKSKGTKAQCAKAISEAKNMPRTLGADKAKGEKGLDGCELKSSSNQETSPNTRSNGQADEIQNPTSSSRNSRNGNNIQPQTASTDKLIADVTALDISASSIPVAESVKYGPNIRPGSYVSTDENVSMNTGVMMDAIRAVELGLTAENRNVSKKNTPLRSNTGVDTAEMELLHRYYPADDTDLSTPRCVTCYELDHRTSDCPLLTCATCGLRGIHFTDACPQSQRCARCRNRGHDKSRCPEKLAATSSEMDCDICQSKNHLEDKCHFLWRSFRPDSLRQKRLLEDIPVYCYCCGTNTHFGSECGIRSTPLNSEGWTWSRANWERYVDVKSNKRVFDFETRKKLKRALSIKDETHELIGLDDDDDDDAEFISQKVKIPPPPINKGKQKIKFISKKNDEASLIPRPDLRPALPTSRQQPPRASKLQRHSNDRDVDYFNSYRPPNDELTRGRGARSISPPPPAYVGDRYGDMLYRPDYDRDVPPFRGYSDGRRGGDGLGGRGSRGGIIRGFGGRGAGNRGGGSTRAERRKRRGAKLNSAA